MMCSFRWGIVSMLGSLLNRIMPTAPHEPERQRILYVCEHELPPEVFALVRLTWYHKGKVDRVDEVVLEEEEDIMPGFTHVIGEALKAGADVSIQTEYDSESLGIYASQ
jgi:hypothetical protein